MSGAQRPRATSGPDLAVVVDGPGRVALREVAPTRGPVAVRTLFSGVSAGTELSFLTGTNPILDATFDADLGLFRPGRPGTGYPVTRLGYMEVARVEANSADNGAGPPVDAVVAMTYGHRSGYRADPLTERMIVLPTDIDPILGIFVAHMGPICANGLLHAAAEVCGPDVRSLSDGVGGRRVAVIGGGTVGLLTGLFAHHHGARDVVVIDPTPQRRAAAEGLGLTALDPEDTDPALVLKSRWRSGPGDRGADVVFQCRGRAAALALALRLLRPQATVIDLAFYTDNGTALRLGAEFHHNGLGIRCAQIGRVPRGTTASWDRDRLSAETITLLRDHGTAIHHHVITDVLPMADGPTLLTDLAARRRHVIQAVLTPA
jgi:NADPH:quinone reductase-like Zn-dependent oxidoreductase